MVSSTVSKNAARAALITDADHDGGNDSQ